jgi:hypothetical protein
MFPSRTALGLIAAAALALLAVPAGAADAQPAKKKAVAAKPAGLPELSAEQLSNAERVFTGANDCEFNQQVEVKPASEKPGYFNVAYKGKTYVMAPEPTTTGAVRLEDKKNGVMWLQIANKSMLMNAKAGRRMVDSCIHPNQKI